MLGLRQKISCGLQILSDEIRIVVIHPGSRSLSMKRCHSEPLAPGVIQNGKIVNEEAVSEAIRHIAQMLGIRGAGIYLSVPTSSTILRKSIFPVMNDKELRNMIDVELNSGSQMPFKDPVFDYVRLGSAAIANPEEKVGRKTKPKQEEVLIFVSPAQVVESYVRVVREAGLKPLSVELESLASFRLLLQYSERSKTQLPECFIMINAESARLEFSIFVEGIPVFLHSVADVGAGASYAKTVTTELSRIMYYFSYSISTKQEDIQALYLLGAEDQLAELPRRLREVFDGQVHTISLEGLLQEQIDAVQAYAIPIGLALKGA
ncbi:type IV pilus biogenesis protein PilM [Paenibacillus agricola]|uniref:Pilus assembly protein PilM n=1 Tax=Paenibacillus agricola TaxID=2716264 RepID=A0ABX0J019_9BACL|nr:pilus assembly protein PilM [Paenibacillus agricola]NHN29579.1 pilus assembly protein PilM [Paenibacillus agricola]